MIPGLTTMLGLGGAVLGGIGGFNQMNMTADQMRGFNNAAGNIWDYINMNGLPNGVANNYYTSAMFPYLDMAQGMSAGNFIPDFWRMGLMGQQGQLGEYRAALNGLMSPGQIGGAGSYLDSNVQPWMDASQQWLSNLLNPAYNNFDSHGSNPFSSQVLDLARMGMGNPYSGTQNDYGAALLRNLGANDMNNGAMSMGMAGMQNGGFNSQIMQLLTAGQGGASAGMGLFNTGGMNPFTSAGLSAGGQGTQGGMNLIGQGMSSGGMNPFLSSMSQFGMNGMQNQFNMTPESFLGPRGTAALDALGLSPNIPRSMNSVYDFVSNATGNSGYTPQGQATWQNAFTRGFEDMDLRNQQMTDDRQVALNFAGQGMDELPSWFAPFVSAAGGILSGQGMGGGGGFNIPQISGGGGGGGASAGALSRDLGPDYQKAVAEFQKNPLLDMTEVLSMARDAAATASAGQSNRNMRLAQANGRMGPVMGSGVQNQAIADMADQALQAEAAAVREALMGQQGLQLQRSGQQGDFAKAIGGLNAQMNIADAGNQTQASIASSQSADAAAARALQAQIANASNSMGMQQMYAQLAGGMFNNLLNTASQSRGQNLEKSIAGLNVLPQIQANANNRDSILFGAMNSAGQQANDRFSMGGNALGILPQLNSNDIARYQTMLNPLVAGQETGTARGGMFGNYGTTAMNNASSNFGNILGTGANLFGSGANAIGQAGNNASNFVNAGTNMFSAGTGAMGNAITGANNNFGNNANLYTGGMNNALGFANLGNDMINGGQNSILQYLSQLNQGTNNQLTYGLGSGQLGASLGQGIGSNANSLGQLGLGFGNLNATNNSNAATMLNNYFTALNNSWNPFFSGANMATGGYQNISDQMLRYMLAAGPGAIGTYGGMFGAPQASNPFVGMFPNTSFTHNSQGSGRWG